MSELKEIKTPFDQTWTDDLLTYKQNQNNSVTASVHRSPRRHSKRKVFFSFCSFFFPWLVLCFVFFRKRNGQIRSKQLLRSLKTVLTSPWKCSTDDNKFPWKTDSGHLLVQGCSNFCILEFKRTSIHFIHQLKPIIKSKQSFFVGVSGGKNH